MREIDVIQKIMNADETYSINQLADILQISSPTLRKFIKNINDNSDNGCHIEIIRNIGIQLLVEDSGKFSAYYQSSHKSIDYSDQNKRINMILFYLLQTTQYITIQTLCDYTDLSRTTIQKSLKEIPDVLQAYHLDLQTKRHFGMKVVGNEVDFRKAFTYFVVNSELYLKPVQHYLDFISSTKQMDQMAFLKEMRNIFNQNQMVISELALQNILDHLKTIIYRLHQKNLVMVNPALTQEIDSRYFNMAKEISALISSYMGISFPKEEIIYLASDLSSKTLDLKQQETIREKYEKKIIGILEILDDEYNTDFSTDKELIINLLFHIQLLVNRMRLNFQLHNPLIDDVYLKYNNVFTIAIRFSEMLSELLDIKELSRDEIGFLTLHFAVHFEKNKRRQLSDIKRIVIICATGRSTSILLKLKMESLFANAFIVTISMNDLYLVEKEKPDLILSTIPIGTDYKNIPIIQIKEFLDENEIETIKNHVLFTLYQKKIENTGSFTFLTIFKKDLFQIVDGGDYFDLIEKQAEKMCELNMAPKTFPSLVIRREMKYPTIFMNGIASPHPLQLVALEDSVGITILRKPFKWNHKEIRLIFLINLKSDDLFIHQELQRLLLQIIENDDLREQLLHAVNFESFINILKKLA